MKQKIPDYYPTMFLDGYKPWEIMAAAHKKMIAAAQTPAEPQDDYTVNVKSTVEVKK